MRRPSTRTQIRSPMSSRPPRSRTTSHVRSWPTTSAILVVVAGVIISRRPSVSLVAVAGLAHRSINLASNSSDPDTPRRMPRQTLVEIEPRVGEDNELAEPLARHIQTGGLQMLAQRPRLAVVVRDQTVEHLQFARAPLVDPLVSVQSQGSAPVLDLDDRDAPRRHDDQVDLVAPCRWVGGISRHALATEYVPEARRLVSPHDTPQRQLAPRAGQDLRQLGVNANTHHLVPVFEAALPTGISRPQLGHARQPKVLEPVVVGWKVGQGRFSGK
jgi:hypothetical protein